MMNEKSVEFNSIMVALENVAKAKESEKLTGRVIYPPVQKVKYYHNREPYSSQPTPYMPSSYAERYWRYRN